MFLQPGLGSRGGYGAAELCGPPRPRCMGTFILTYAHLCFNRFTFMFGAAGPQHKHASLNIIPAHLCLYRLGGAVMIMTIFSVWVGTTAGQPPPPAATDHGLSL